MKSLILHSDLNAFYASVEMNEHPELRGKLMAVCGSTENRHRLRESELAAKGVQITVKDIDLDSRQYQAQLHYPTQSPLEIAQAAFALFRERYTWLKPVRALTVRGIDLLSEKQPVQIDMFSDYTRRDRQRTLDGTIEEIRKRFGYRSIYAAALMGDLNMAKDKCETVTMPGLMYM